jgi:hypothetical protein
LFLGGSEGQNTRMLTVIVILKTLVEVAGLALLGQGILYILAGANREQNFFYRILKTITQPVWRLVRFMTPRVIVDQHIGFVVFLLLVLAWYFLLAAQVEQCRGELAHPSCERLRVDYVKRCEGGDNVACEVLRRNNLAPAGAKP